MSSAILDLRELVHQAAASRPLLLALVAATAASRVATLVVSLVAIVAGARLRGSTQSS